MPIIFLFFFLFPLLSTAQESKMETSESCCLCYYKIIIKAEQTFASGNWNKSLKYYERAHVFRPNDQTVIQQIDKLKAILNLIEHLASKNTVFNPDKPF